MMRNISQLLTPVVIIIAFMMLPFVLAQLVPIVSTNFEQDVRVIVQDELVKQGLIQKEPNDNP